MDKGTAQILKLNAYGHRWHVLVEGRGIVYGGQTKRSCASYCRRHPEIKIWMDAPHVCEIGIDSALNT